MAHPVRSSARLWRRGLLALNLVVLFACARSGHAVPVEIPMNPKSLLDQIQTLSAERPFTAAVVQGATGVSVAPVTSESNPYFTVYRSEKGAGNGAWSSVEVRSPTSLSAGKGGMVLLHIASPCVKASDVGDRFGAAEPGEPTSPDMPPGSPEYTVYHQPWGALRLGFSPSSECLDTVVLDANG